MKVEDRRASPSAVPIVSTIEKPHGDQVPAVLGGGVDVGLRAYRGGGERTRRGPVGGLPDLTGDGPGATRRPTISSTVPRRACDGLCGWPSVSCANVAAASCSTAEAPGSLAARVGTEPEDGSLLSLSV